MSLLDRINAERVLAMKDKRARHKDVLTTLKGEIERKHKQATNEEVKAVIKASLKALATMIVEKERAGMSIDAEIFEQEVLGAYMPTVMDEAATHQAVTEAIAATGASGMKDMGKVMGTLAKYGELLDKGIASGIVRKLLA